MADVTIAQVLKDKFYNANAQGVEFSWRDDDSSQTPLNDRQKEELETLLDSFFADLGKHVPIEKVKFNVSTYGSVSMYKYNPEDPVDVRIPGMRQAYDGMDSYTFEDYLDRLKAAYGGAIKLAEWMNKFDMTNISLDMEYDNQSGSVQFLEKLAYFEAKILPKFIEKYGEHEITLRLSTGSRNSFNYRYNDYNDRGSLSVDFSLGDTNSSHFVDHADDLMEKNVGNLIEVIDFFLKHDKMGSSFDLNSYDQHLATYYDDMKKTYLDCMKEVVEHLLKEVPEEQLEINFTIGTRASFDYYSSSSSKTFRFELPYANAWTVMRSKEKDAVALYKSFNTLIFALRDWVKKTGIPRINFDGDIVPKLADEKYTTQLLESLKKFVEDKVEIAQRGNASFSFVKMSSFRNDRNELSYLQLPTPDCYDDELGEWMDNFLSNLEFTA